MSLIEPSGTIVVRNARGRYVLYLLGSLGFVALGAFLIAEGDAFWAGLLNVVFFGLCAVVFLRQLFDRRPRLVLDAHGVTDRMSNLGRIDWADILDADLVVYKGQHFMRLTLRDEAQRIQASSSMRQAGIAMSRGLGFGAFQLNLSGVDEDPRALLAVVRAAIVRNDPMRDDPAPDSPGAIAAQDASARDA